MRSVGQQKGQPHKIALDRKNNWWSCHFSTTWNIIFSEPKRSVQAYITVANSSGASRNAKKINEKGIIEFIHYYFVFLFVLFWISRCIMLWCTDDTMMWCYWLQPVTTPCLPGFKGCFKESNVGVIVWQEALKSKFSSVLTVTGDCQSMTGVSLSAANRQLVLSCMWSVEGVEMKGKFTDATNAMKKCLANE